MSKQNVYFDDVVRDYRASRDRDAALHTDVEGLTVRDRKGNIDADKTLANITRAEWQNYKEKWEPRERELIEKAKNDTSLIDYAKQDAAQSTALVQGIVDRNASRYGAALTPAQLQEQRRALQRGDTLTDVQSIQDARVAQKDSNRALMSDLINIGQGVSRDSLGALQNAASNASAREQAYKNAKSAHKAQTYSTLGMLGAAAILAFPF